MTDAQLRLHRQPSVQTRRVLAAVAAMLFSITACSAGPVRPAMRDARHSPTTADRPPTSSGPATGGGGQGAPLPPSTVRTRPATVAATDTLPSPVRLRVPSIDVDAAVVPVGVEADGKMAVPAAETAGWYRFGPRPGERGSSVLAAHVDYDGRPGAFFRLRQLEAGAAVAVSMSDGSSRSFKVVRLVKIDKADLAASGVFDRSGPSMVALITCGGGFDRSRHSYEDNVVAIAAPAG